MKFNALQLADLVERRYSEGKSWEEVKKEIEGRFYEFKK